MFPRNLKDLETFCKVEWAKILLGFCAYQATNHKNCLITVLTSKGHCSLTYVLLGDQILISVNIL